MNNPSDTADTVLEGLGAKKWCWQLEEGENGTRHIQGVLYFANARTFKSLKNAVPRARWDKARSLKACVKYCSKVKTRIGPTNIKGFEIPEEIFTISEEDLEVWQEDILKLIAEPCTDTRTIHWFWEPKGGIGKTEFCKYLCVHKKDVRYVTGRAVDMKYSIVKFVEKHKRGPKVLLCDFPREYENYVSYMGIEQMKNEIFFSGKYESDQCIYNSPHLLCFANFPPRLPALSEDRWHVVNLETDVI